MDTQLDNILDDYLDSEQCKHHLRPFLRYLSKRHKQQGGITEIRVGAGVDSTDFVAFIRPKDVDAAVEALTPVPDTDTDDGHPRIGAAVVSFIPHPVAPALYGKSEGRFVAGEPDGDGDIIAYSMFGLRIEPVRPHGAPPTDEERRQAGKVASAVAWHFMKSGVNPIALDSGNRLELVIPTERYPDVAHAFAEDRTLSQLLDQKFSTEHVKVSGTTSGPGYALPLPGTLMVLGAPTPDRPHRFVFLTQPECIPTEDVDLFALFAEEIAAFRTEQEEETRSPAEESTVTQPGRAAGWDAETSCKVLAAVLQRSGLKFRAKENGEDRHFEFKDCPCDGAEGRSYACRIIVHADGTFAAHCDHDGSASWKDFRPLVGWDEHARAVMKELGVAPRSMPYRATDSGLVFLYRRGKATHKVRLTNYTARILRDVEEDDGVETRHTFLIQASLDGRESQFPLTAAEFGRMDWPPERLGARAVTYPNASKAHVRAAIQLLSGEVSTEKVYKHIGWREHAGEYVYLHAAGGIGRDGVVPGVRVDLPEALSRYRLPPPPSGAALRTAVRASLRMLDVAPVPVTVPLYGGIWRVAIGTTDFSEHITGGSGAGKSELATLGQQHWGKELDSRHLPASWLSTSASIEMLAFLAQDAILVVDDFVPASGGSESSRQHREADRVMRGQGNSAGRGRLRSDATLRSPRPPRGLIVSTGEDTPRGQSLRARLMVEKLLPGMVNWEQMTACQADAADGLYAAAFAAYVRWLAARLEDVRRDMPKRLAELREQATASSGQHKRTPGIVASLYYGIELFVQFARDEAKALSEKEAEAFLQRCWAALGEAAAAQATVQGHGEPAQRFLKLINAAIIAGKAHVAGTDGEAPAGAAGRGWREEEDGWAAAGDLVGWVDGPDLYLEPEASYAIAQRMGQDAHEPLEVAPKSLHKRLREQGHLVSVDAARDRLTARRTLEGQVRTVLHLRAEALGPVSSAESSPGGNGAAKRRSRKG